jgi:hypothetical protein
MIGQMRSRSEMERIAATGTIAPAAVAGTAHVAFAAEMARSSGTGGAPGMVALWQETTALAMAGGGAARITVALGSGEPVDLRVVVRQGQVSVLALVSDQAAEVAIQGASDRIAQALRDAGLSLARFHVQRVGDAGDGGSAGCKRAPSRDRGRRTTEEEAR